ncbi:MAG: hypothetical protein CMP81_24410 [Fulvimarina sp.]|nr:hypothetical protein [Fulvimarina sp.]
MRQQRRGTEDEGGHDEFDPSRSKIDLVKVIDEITRRLVYECELQSDADEERQERQKSTANRTQLHH